MPQTITILSLLHVMTYLIAELRKPIFNPIGIFDFKTRSITIHTSTPMSIIPYKQNDSKGIELLNVRVGSDKRFIEFLFLNSRLVPILTAMEIIYGIITKNLEYIRFSNKKVLITYIIGIEHIDHGDGYPETRKIEITLHKNTVVSNSTTWGEFYSFIRGYIKQSYLDGYNFDIPTMFRVRVWSVDHMANTKLKVTNGRIRSNFNKNI